MKKSKPQTAKREVLLWPEKKVYSLKHDLLQLQRVPLVKFSCSGLSGTLVFFDGEPINLN
jgi:hypothetical protein